MLRLSSTQDRFLENFIQNDELVSKDVQLQFVFLQNELHFQKRCLLS